MSDIIVQAQSKPWTLANVAAALGVSGMLITGAASLVTLGGIKAKAEETGRDAIEAKAKADISETKNAVQDAQIQAILSTLGRVERKLDDALSKK